MNTTAALVSLEQFKPIISIADGLTLGQVCAVTGLETSTIQNWVKRGFVPKPISKKYGSRHLARILLISALRDCMQLERIGELMTIINGDTDDESDDIISEEMLYEYFLKIASELNTNSYPEDKLPELVCHIMSGYSEKTEHIDRLNSALTAMAYAYVAGRYKSRSENIINILKEKHNG